MTDSVEKRILEHLRLIRGGIAGVKQKISDLKLRGGSVEDRLTLVECGVVNFHADIALVHGRLVLLAALSPKLVVPAAVHDEVRAGLVDDPRAAASMPFRGMAGQCELSCVADVFYLRALKNALSWLPHSSPRMPPVISMR